MRRLTEMSPACVRSRPQRHMRVAMQKGRNLLNFRTPSITWPATRGLKVQEDLHAMCCVRPDLPVDGGWCDRDPDPSVRACSHYKGLFSTTPFQGMTFEPRDPRTLPRSLHSGSQGSQTIPSRHRIEAGGRSRSAKSPCLSLAWPAGA